MRWSKEKIKSAYKPEVMKDKAIESRFIYVRHQNYVNVGPCSNGRESTKTILRHDQ